MKFRFFSPLLKFSRLMRIKIYITKMESVYKPSKKKIKKVAPLNSHIDKTIMKAIIASWLRNFFNIIIYASAIITLSSVFTNIDITFFSTQLRLVTSIIGGTTVAIIGATIATRFVNLYVVDLLLLASTVIAVYTSPEDDIDKIDVFSVM